MKAECREKDDCETCHGGDVGDLVEENESEQGGEYHVRVVVRRDGAWLCEAVCGRDAELA